MANATPEERASPVGYYMLHSCADSADHQDQCNAVFVWASSPEEALSLDPEKHRDPETVEVERKEKADAFHALLGPMWGNGWGKGDKFGWEERAYRACGFHEDSGTTCDTCGLGEFSKAPESKVCRECLQCAECGCMCSERLDDEIKRAEAAAFKRGLEAADQALGLDETLARSPFFQRHAREVIRARAKEAPRG